MHITSVCTSFRIHILIIIIDNGIFQCFFFCIITINITISINISPESMGAINFFFFQCGI